MGSSNDKSASKEKIINQIRRISPLNSPVFTEIDSSDFNFFIENPYYLSQHENSSYNPFPFPQNFSNDLNNPHNDGVMFFQKCYLAKPNDFNILNVDPSQNDKDYAEQKRDIESENAIKIEGKFFLIYILIGLETDGITFKINYKENEKIQTENSLLNKKHKRSKKKNDNKVYYKQFKREDLNKIIQESNLPHKLKKEIYKPRINKFIEKFKESTNFFGDILNFSFKDIYTFGKETEELQRLNDETISNFLEYCQKIGDENLDENLKKIKIFFNIKISDFLPKEWRLDYCIKHIKTAISQYETKILNQLINESDLPENYKKTINKPNSKYFTANDKIKDNTKFLSKSVKEIFTIRKNINILNICKYFKQICINDLTEKNQKIINFLETTYQDLIKHFYDSEEFGDFKENIKSQFYEYGIIKERKTRRSFSILKDYGLIKIFQREYN